MTSSPVDQATRERPAAVRSVSVRPATLFGIAVFAAAGWGWGAWERFVEIPGALAGQRIATALELVDKFALSEAQRSYVKLSDDLKPWWDMIQDKQRRIMAETRDAEREALIAARDELLLAFIRDKDLGPSIELLVDSFEQFDRCLTVDACDEDILRKSIAIDVKRIYRTFKPYIQAKREAGNGDERKDFGKGLEGLFFRFLG